MTSEKSSPLRIALVGPCASGKSTLAKLLASENFEIRHVAQDHSFVPDMWRRVSRPDVLIYLDINYETIKARRPITTLRPADLVEQERRLAHAKKHCDLLIDTSPLTPVEVAAQALDFLNSLQP